MRGAWAAALAAFLLAGCGGAASDPSGEGPGAGPAGTAGDSAGIPLPSWAVGDAWTYTLNGAPTTYVITSQTASDWVIETDSPERAFSDLRDDVSRLGPQRKSDLAGSQGSARVEFFQWPLQAGKNWTSTWDHAPVAIRVLSVRDGVAELEARLANATASDPPVYRYTYDAADRWFSRLVHYNPDGSELVNLQLTSATHNWTGTLARWELDPVIFVEGALGQPVAMNYDVPLTATDVWVDAAVHCTSGVAQVGTSPFPFAGGLTGQDDRGGGAAGEPCPSDEAFTGSAGAPRPMPQGGPAETWGYAVAGSDSAGTYRLEVVVRTFVPVPFP